MNLAIWIVAGALLGLMTSLVGRTRSRQGIALFIVAGAMGAVLGGRFISPLLGAVPGPPDPSEGLSLGCLAVALGTSAVFLAIARLVRGRRRGWSIPKNSGF
jgi:uncharacterized membrane protein YeaQ/YmgE (transglycosylase-associated protein family)